MPVLTKITIVIRVYSKQAYIRGRRAVNATAVGSISTPHIVQLVPR